MTKVTRLLKTPNISIIPITSLPIPSKSRVYLKCLNDSGLRLLKNSYKRENEKKKDEANLRVLLPKANILDKIANMNITEFRKFKAKYLDISVLIQDDQIFNLVVLYQGKFYVGYSHSFEDKDYINIKVD